MRVVATAGHVDHGKSTLVERLTGVHPDRWDEERRRGLTIDLGFGNATLQHGGRTAEVSFIDVPGHVRFLRNMLAGVGGVDACVFVVAATEGWKPQSEEHLRILDLLGLRHGIVALTKSDAVDADTLELQTMEVRDRLAATFLADAPIVPVSAITGFGLDQLHGALCDLVEQTPSASDRGRPRLWIDRVFAARGSGTVVTGTLTGGSLHIDQRLVVAGREVRVRGLQSHGVAHASLAPGNRVAVNLVGVDHDDLVRGDALVEEAAWHHTARFDASLTVLSSLTHSVERRGSYLAYVGSGEFPVRVRVLGDTGIAPGHDGLVRLHLLDGHTLPLLPGDRFVLRETGRDETVGGGEVLDVAPVLPASRARPDRSIERVVAERGWIDVDTLRVLTGEEVPPTLGSWVVDPAELERTRTAIRSAVERAAAEGLDVAALSPHQRALIDSLDEMTVKNGRVRHASLADAFADHPFLDAARRGGCAPPDPIGLDPAHRRELVRRHLLVERDGILFHPSAIETAANAAAQLLAQEPTGFTVSGFREMLGITRKHAVPLAAELDSRGITRRRGDLRIAGPRLPTVT